METAGLSSTSDYFSFGVCVKKQLMKVVFDITLSGNMCFFRVLCVHSSAPLAKYPINHWKKQILLESN